VHRGRVTARSFLPSRLLDLPFARQTAVSSGVSASRLRARDLRTPFHGVWVDAALPCDVFWSSRAYLERMSATNVFSHVTAAQLYRLPVPQYLADARIIHVSRSAGGTAPSGRGVMGHELSGELWQTRDVVHREQERGELFAFPVVAPGVLWAQLAEVLDGDDLVALGDAIVTGPSPLAGIQDLRAVVELCAGRRGARSMRDALPSIRSGPLSRPESLVRLQMVRGGLPEPVLNSTVHDQHGERIGEPDFCWPEFRVLAEYDSEQFHGERRRRPDRERLELYNDGGWASVVAYRSDVFTDPNPFLGRLARRLRAGGWRPDREPWHIAGARR